MAVSHFLASIFLPCLIASWSLFLVLVHLFIAARMVSTCWISFGHYHLDFGNGLDQCMDFSIAGWSYASSASAACSVVFGVDQVEFVKCRSAIVDSNLAPVVLL